MKGQLMNSLTKLLVALQAVPIVNRIPFIANVGTLDHALQSVTKAANLVGLVAATERAVEAGLDKAIETLTNERSAVRDAAERAERIARRFDDLLA